MPDPGACRDPARALAAQAAGTGEGDLTVLARRYEWDMDALWQDLLSWLDKQPRSVRHRPQLSDHTLRLMQEARLIASLSGEAQIRSVHLLMALVEKQNLIQCDGLWPLLTLGQRQLERLRSLLDAQSDERPPAQQEAALAQPHGGDVEFVGRPAGSELNADGLNPALQNALDKFTLDVTAKARDGQIDPVFGRDMEIRQMVDILSRRRKTTRSSSVSRAWARPLWWKARRCALPKATSPTR